MSSDEQKKSTAKEALPQEEPLLSKKVADTADKAMKGYFIFGTIATDTNEIFTLLAKSFSQIPCFFSYFSSIPIIGFFTGPIWNLFDFIWGIASAPENIRKAKLSLTEEGRRKFLARLNIAGCFAMLGLTAWGSRHLLKATTDTTSAYSFFHSLINAHSLTVSGTGLAGSAAAASSFGFAAAMFIAAANSFYLSQCAKARSSEEGLYKDCKEKIERLEAKINGLKGLDTKNQSPADSKTEETEVKNNTAEEHIATNNQKTIEKLNVRLKRLKKQRDILEKIINNKPQDESKTIKEVKEITSAENLVIEFLKEKNKAMAEKYAEDASAWFWAGCGATLTGFSILFPITSIALAPAAAVCYSYAAYIKAKQLNQERKVKKILDKVFERKQNETNQEYTERKERIEDEKIASYFKISDSKDIKDIKESLSPGDLKYIVGIQCMKPDNNKITSNNSQSFVNNIDSYDLTEPENEHIIEGTGGKPIRSQPQDEGDLHPTLCPETTPLLP